MKGCTTMMENCVISYAEQMQIQNRHSGEPVCEHCYYHQFGCPNKPAFEVRQHGLTHRYVATEQSSDELPKVGIWCRSCKDNCARIFHETIWNGKKSYAIRCRRCGSTYLMYKSRVEQQYTGFVNGRGDFVHPDRYLTGRPQITPGVAGLSPFFEEMPEWFKELEASISPEERRAVEEERERQRREAERPVVVYSAEENHRQPTAMELAMRKAMEKKAKAKK